MVLVRPARREVRARVDPCVWVGCLADHCARVLTTRIGPGEDATMSKHVSVPISRRSAIRLVAAGVGAGVLTGCGGSAPPSAVPLQHSAPQPVLRIASATATPASAVVSARLAEPKPGGTIRRLRWATLPTWTATTPTSSAPRRSRWPTTSWPCTTCAATAAHAGRELGRQLRQPDDQVQPAQRRPVPHRPRVHQRRRQVQPAPRARPEGAASGTLAPQSAWFTTIETPDKYTVMLKSDQPRPASSIS